MSNPIIRRVELSIPGTMGFGNAYAIVNGERAALIDTGMASAQNVDALQTQLGKWGHTFGSLDKVVCTHFHPDHCGLSRQFQDAGTDVFLSSTDAAALEFWQQSASVDRRMATFYGEHPLPSNFSSSVLPSFSFLRSLQEEFHPCILGSDGSLVDLAGIPFEVIETPGHTDGHVCLLQREMNVLITGDHVLPNTIVNIAFGQQSRFDSALSQYMQSLRRLALLGPLDVYPGHGIPFKNLATRCLDLLQQHRQKVQQVLDALTLKPVGAFELSCLVFGEKRRPFSKWLNMAQTISCLEYLALQQQASCLQKGNMLYYMRVE
ncbi:MAG: MBL fold metallo-hydrolase [Deltaproteobacteria bacterium]|nr:MBL fold metallo-hydrolase [Deltaproteobacteria bacterium]